MPVSRKRKTKTKGDIEELAAELADSWQFGAPRALYHTCSPHRVALLVPHLRNFYLDDFAADAGSHGIA